MLFLLVIKQNRLLNNANVFSIWTKNMTTRTKVKISEGIIVGKELNATYFSKKKYFAFQGIPYAQPPVGNLRFQDPQPPLPWQGVLEVVEEGPPCPHRNVLFKDLVGQEDNCLVLNVYAPESACAGQTALPVMVWFHGGGFTFGSGNTDLQDPDYWMDRDVIIVTCNYRLGVLGFLSLGTEEVPGNAGLKDQVMVLRWVKRNILHFGGDPHKVTIFGESAGAASVHYHLFSPMSRGLFHRAILMSGCSLNTWTIAQNPVERSFALGQQLGCKTRDSQELLKFLRSVPVFDIIKIQSKVVTHQDKQDGRAFPFVPCVEPVEGKGERFLTEYPHSLLQRGLVAPVPLIIGSNDKEGMIVMKDTPHTDQYLKFLNSNFSRIVPMDLDLPPDAAERIKQFFFGNNPISWETINEYLDFYGDVLFYIGLDETIRLHLAIGLAPVYCYSFKLDGDMGMLSYFIRQMYSQAKLQGVCHADDLGYIFKYNTPGMPQLKPNSPESDMVSHITAMLSHFAKTGDPNAPGEITKWGPAIKDGASWKGYLELDHQIRMQKTRLNEKRIKFWDSLRQPHSKL